MVSHASERAAIGCVLAHGSVGTKVTLQNLRREGGGKSSRGACKSWTIYTHTSHALSFEL